VSQAANRKATLEFGPANTTVPIFDGIIDPRSVILTPNNNTPYTLTFGSSTNPVHSP